MHTKIRVVYEKEASKAKHSLMEQTSLLNGQADKKQHAICKQMRKVKSKGAIVVLVWSFFIVTVSYYLITFVVPYSLEITTVALGLTLPLAGWLADIRFGRYKVMRWSMWIMWLAAMLTTLSSIVAQFITGDHILFRCVSQIMVFILTIGFGGYQANAVQFGIDQLQGASTTEITAFITWYIWTYFCNGALFYFTHICVKREYYIFGQLLACISITVVISSSYFLQSSLVKEPVTQNPFKLIYKVLHYAIKNKHPRYRSAFTYCEDELPSRIDFGKSKYGGPFTTEQVEDVKTFLRLLIVTAMASILAGLIVILRKLHNEINKGFIHFTSTQYLKECYTEKFYAVALPYCIIAIFIPLHEFILYPTLQRCFSSVKIYQKFFLGMTLQIAEVIMLIVCDVVARKKYIEHHGHNATIQCRSQEPLHASSSLYKNWVAIPNILETISITLLSISSIEFLMSQTPYSMRGLMTGLSYGGVFLFTIVQYYGIYWPFTHHSSTWGTGIISCEFWYLLSVLVVLIIVSGILLAVGRWYKNRKRQDVLPNEHIFAERYYSQLN